MLRLLMTRILIPLLTRERHVTLSWVTYDCSILPHYPCKSHWTLATLLHARDLLPPGFQPNILYLFPFLLSCYVIPNSASRFWYSAKSTNYEALHYCIISQSAGIMFSSTSLDDVRVRHKKYSSWRTLTFRGRLKNIKE